MRSSNTKRRCQFSSSLLVSDPNRPSRRSKFMNTNINDLPEDALVEIFYRFDCYKFVAQGKCVSKRWCNLMSDPSFIGTFVSHKSDKHSPIKHTLLHRSGLEFLGRMSTSTELRGRVSTELRVGMPTSTEPLTPLFERLKSCNRLKREPVVVGSYNDLILCSTSSKDESLDYFICNPFTVQWVTLPPPPQVYEDTPVGFICDLPYYNWSTGNQGESSFHLNAEYKCRVVRLICPEDQKETLLNEFQVQIYSSETGNWIETIISFPTPFCFEYIDYSISYANKGMIYWGGHTHEDKFLIGFNPFKIKNKNSSGLSVTSSSTNGGDIIEHNEGCFIELSQKFWYCSPFGVYKGCMRICNYDDTTYTLYIVDLNDEEIHEVRLDQKRNYTLNEEMIPRNNTVIKILGFDPDDDDILYVLRSRDIVEYNVRTRTWSMVAEKTLAYFDGSLFPYGSWYPVTVPVVPTPVHMLARHSSTSLSDCHPWFKATQACS